MLLVITEGMVTALVSLASLVVGVISKYWLDKYQKSKSKHDAYNFLENANEDLFIKQAKLRKEFLEHSEEKDTIIEQLSEENKELSTENHKLSIQILNLENELNIFRANKN